MKTSTKMIVALIALQCFTHVFYFSKVLRAEEDTASCRLANIRQTTAVMTILNDINDEYKKLLRAKEKTTYRPKIVVSK